MKWIQDGEQIMGNHQKKIASAFNLLGDLAGRAALELKKKSREIYPWQGLCDLDRKLAAAAPDLLKKETFYIEVGANDGVNQSNTFFLEHIYGAKGMLIEASPSLFEKCIHNRSQKNIFEHCALASNEYPTPYMELIYSNLMTVSTSSTEVDPKQHAKNGLSFFSGRNYAFFAPVKTLGQLIETHNIDKVDILSIDLEGYEIEALKGARLDKGWIKNILVESREIEQLRPLMHAHGYTLTDKLSHWDYLFRLGYVKE